jgi:hypothetical protein
MQRIIPNAGWGFVVMLLTTTVLLAACSPATQTDPATTLTVDSTGDQAATPGSAGAAPGDTEHQAEARVLPADAVVINMDIANRTTNLTREDLRVSQGDTVGIFFTSDEAGEIHLHGYDLTAEVSPEHAADIVFEARIAGAFGINFHVFAQEDGTGQKSMGNGDHGGQHPMEPEEGFESEVPIKVEIRTIPNSMWGADVHIDTEGLRWAPELVDQEPTAGTGHAHIYVDGEKISLVFSDSYQLQDLEPGDREIKVSLNANNHQPYHWNGQPVEHTIMFHVESGDHAGHDSDGSQNDDHGSGHDSDRDREIVAEVHLGNLEVYP